MPLSDENLMDQALRLAAQGRGWVSPNPMVGALVVKDGVIVGRGWHRQFGGPHAEIFALEEAGARAQGGTLYSTLEPCNHTGKTPPCTQAILRAGIAAVVIGARDPHPIAGGGRAVLAAAGVRIAEGVHEAACRRLNAGFFKFVQTDLPLVSLKWAMSADGRIAAAGGDSKWITSPAARQRAHRLRARHDAVLVGIGTVLKDAPHLNARPELTVPPIAECKQPRRVILDSRARTPLDAPLWDVPGAGRVTIFCGQEAPAKDVQRLQERGAEVIRLNSSEARLPLRDALRELGARGVLSVLVEGGSEVLGSFIDAKAGDMAHVFVAPKIVGGRDAVPAAGGQGAANVAESIPMREPRVEELGGDVLLSGVLSEWEDER